MEPQIAGPISIPQVAGKFKQDKRVSSLIDSVAAVKAQMEKLCADLAAQQKIVKDLVAKQAAKTNSAHYVRSTSFKKAKIHISCSSPEAPPEEWYTQCGWPYAAWKFERFKTITESQQAKLCGTCMKARSRIFDEVSECSSTESPN